MHIRRLTDALGALTLSLLSSPLVAHAGLYRGPIVPAAPQAVDPRGSSTPAPTAQNPVVRTTDRRGFCGTMVTEDYSSWQYWWELNKHAYLGLRRAVHHYDLPREHYFAPSIRRKDYQLAPTNKQIHEDILPALKRAIDSTEQPGLVSSCMMAMAKIGEDHKDFALVDVFRPRLRNSNQQVRETAALAMGISAVASEKALDHLVALSLDSATGRELSGGKVHHRTSVFALYGLGLYSNQHHGPTVQRRALHTMRSVLEDKSIRDRNLKVAAIQGMGLLALDKSDAASLAMLYEALDSLRRYYTKRAGYGTQFVQSNCPNAITKLIGRDHPRRGDFIRLFVNDLKGKNKHRRGTNLARSSVLALGQLCHPYDDQHSPDKGYSELLFAAFQNHEDDQTRYFSLLALGQIGGEKNQQFLLRILETDSRQLERPWAALALGVQAFAKHKVQTEEGAVVEPATLIGEALARQLGKAKRPELVGALGVALGLARYIPAADQMRQRLLASLTKEEQAGYMCLGLAMMRDLASIETIQETMKASWRRPGLFVQSAIALGLLGDKRVSSELHKKFGDQTVSLATLSARSEALGQVGDGRLITPLKHALFDDNFTDMHRAFAAAALGAVADRAVLPWHSTISKHLNYRAAVETLIDGHSGVLDLF